MGIIIYSAFSIIRIAIFTHTKTVNFIHSKFVTMKVKLNENDVIVESDTINIDSSFGLSLLFGHEILPDTGCYDALFRPKSVILVLSHCHHPLHWVAEFLKGYEELIAEVWVFTKCNIDVVSAPNGSKIIKLPNVGGCDHTYAHAIQMYAGLPVKSDNDIIVFLKDTFFEISQNSLGSQNFGDLLCIVEFYGFGCLPMEDVKVPLFSEFDLLRSFTMTKHNRQGGSVISVNETEVPFNNTNINSFGEWLDNLSLPIFPTQNITMACYGGNFATTKKQIMKKPMWVWEAIEHSLSRGNNIIEGHFVERAWASLLAKPLNNATASKIWESQPNIDKAHYFLKGKLTLNLSRVHILELQWYP